MRDIQLIMTSDEDHSTDDEFLAQIPRNCGG